MLHHQSLSPRSTSMVIDLNMPIGVAHHVSSSSASSTGTGPVQLGDCFSPTMSFTTDRTDFDLLATAANLFSTEDSNDAANQNITEHDCGSSDKDLNSLLFSTEFTPFLEGTLSSQTLAHFASGHINQVPLSVPSLELPHDPGSHTTVQHSCFTRALRSLEKLSSDSCLGRPGVPPTAAGIIANNEAVMESLGSMLECSCSEDGYLLYLAALIMSKALDSYAYVARQSVCFPQLESSSSSHAHTKSCESTNSSSNPNAPKILANNTSGRQESIDHGGAESARITAQLVLGELYLVRRLIAKLSSKLKGRAAEVEEDLRATGMQLENNNFVRTKACLLTVGDHFAEALSRRLKALSLDISHHLRAA
ncbi:hypothetical protein NLG97_g4545 [Lecanicillium saksenae]|uniref:Uncharacterized protein n=1 Tax=Lecanicillium saksenae TaxID=468837 RepID=A0ACC1QW67_9HYPO|nr:hypothetical protein NLG97_g4545 [Lecanicillium saksenae]